MAGCIRWSNSRIRRARDAEKENILAFVFTDEHGDSSFTNTYVYDPKTNTWENHLDNVVKGEAKPFARFKLTRQ